MCFYIFILLFSEGFPIISYFFFLCLQVIALKRKGQTTNSLEVRLTSPPSSDLEILQELLFCTFLEIFPNSLFCHIRIPFYDGESFAYSPCEKVRGWKKKLHNNLPMKNGLGFFVNRFSS